MDKKKHFAKLGELLSKFDPGDRDKYVSREFQKYGYDLATELDEPNRVSLYIKIAKEYPRGQVEAARSFVKDASNVKNKGRLFLWKLKELKTKK